MTPQQIDLTIARIIGWTNTHLSWKNWDGPNTQEAVGTPPQAEHPSVIEQVPNYTGSLDAMHEAEMWLRGTDEQQNNVVAIHRRWHSYQYLLIANYGPCATAEERAKTFLEIIRWEAEKQVMP